MALFFHAMFFLSSISQSRADPDESVSLLQRHAKTFGSDVATLDSATDWVPVDCSSGNYLWSSSRSYTTTESADSHGTLYTVSGGCTHDGQGWRSTTPTAMSYSACGNEWYHLGDKYGGYTGNCGGHQYSDLYKLTFNDPTCQGNSCWVRVSCSAGNYLWSSSRSYTTTESADLAGVLYTVDGGCTHDGQGWRSTSPTTMSHSACSNEWYHLGDMYGGYTGNCGGHQYQNLYKLTFMDPESSQHCEWVPVDCAQGNYLWSSSRSYTTTDSADSHGTLYTVDGGCTHDGQGWRLIYPSSMSYDACSNEWYHLGDKYGGYTGNCGGHQYQHLYKLTFTNPCSTPDPTLPPTTTTTTTTLVSLEGLDDHEKEVEITDEQENVHECAKWCYSKKHKDKPWIGKKCDWFACSTCPECS